MPDQQDTAQQKTQWVELTIPAAHRYLSILTECIEQMLLHAESPPDTPGEIYNIKLAANEICANIIDHAYETPNNARIQVRLTLNTHPRSFLVEFIDEGKPFDDGRIRIPDLHNLQEDGGLGIYLTHTIMDKVLYEKKDTYNHWQLIKYLSS